MLKVTFTIDCDVCGQPCQTAAVCADPEPMIWEGFALDLTAYVQGNGWDFDEETNKFQCDECLQSEVDGS